MYIEEGSQGRNLREMTLLSVNDLHVYYEDKGDHVQAVDGVSLDLESPNILGILGESGCGKTTFAKSIIRGLPDNAVIPKGEMLLNGEDITEMSENRLQELRWETVAYVPQGAMGSLDPVCTIQEQLTETIHAHRTDVSESEAVERAHEVLKTVGIDPTRITNYPHQLSGGMRQRVLLAMSLILEPELIIADEPTTGLDMLIRDQILEDIETYRDEFGISIIFVSHDIADLVETTDKLAVMYGGKIVERGPSRQLINNPSHPYTIGLRNSLPELHTDPDNLVEMGMNPPDLRNPSDGCRFVDKCPFDVEECHEVHPDYREIQPGIQTACYRASEAESLRAHVEREGWKTKDTRTPDDEGLVPKHRLLSGETVLRVDNLRKYYSTSTGLFSSMFGEEKYIKAVDDVSFTLADQEVLGIIGESGSGKSTLIETILRLEEQTSGSIQFNGQELTEFSSKELRRFRENAQIIFQDPYESLNPRKSVFQSVSEPLRNFQNLRHDELREEVLEILHKVGLRPADTYIDSYPGQLSGGQRQRVNIARSIVLEPDLLVADEPVSMLDVSLQAGIIKMLRRLQRDIGFSMLYVSHNIPVVRLVADRTGVMYRGRLVELGAAADIVENPMHPYTDALVSSMPMLSEERTRVTLADRGDGDDADLPSGCRFHPRCPEEMADCSERTPALETVEGRYVACYLHHDEDMVEGRGD